MLDGLTLDQIRLFVAVADAGGFSAAARELGRAQSAVSYGISNLEEVLGVALFERSGRSARLSPAGRALLAHAREVLAQVGRMRSAAASLAGDVEREVRLAVDAICPTAWLAAVGKAFEEAYPQVSLHVRSDVLGGVVDLVARGQVDLAVCGPEGIARPILDARFLFELEMVPVVAADHPLAAREGPLDLPDLVAVRQIVIGRRGKDDPDGDRAVLSPTTWRVADAATKRELILAGLGWGNLPHVMVEDDLAVGRLARLRIAPFGDAPLRVRLHRLTRRDRTLGPAAKWLAEHLHACPPAPRANTDDDRQPPADRTL